MDQGHDSIKKAAWVIAIGQRDGCAMSGQWMPACDIMVQAMDMIVQMERSSWAL